MIAAAAASPSRGGAQVARLELHRIPGAWGGECIDIRGVGADPFDPAIWQHNTLNLVPDIRRPMIDAQSGRHRNVYAPSVVEIAGGGGGGAGGGGGRGGWRVYFAGWDGTDTPNDRVYCAQTQDDFATFTNRRTLVEHGQFQHVCNVNVTPASAAAGGFAMMCTAYPDANGKNKPATFFSRDGVHWNDAADGVTFAATRRQIVDLAGYGDYPNADINGMNVLLFEDGIYRMYFGDFASPGKTWRASGADGRRFKLDGVALDRSPLVNDVKKFRTADRHDWYLMGLHCNAERLFVSISRDGARFPEAQPLCTNVDDVDRYIVSIGWVTQGAQDEPGRRLLGLLYGAGPKASLDDNRIFARWLQKKLVFTVDGKSIEPKTRALGPERQLLFFDKPVTAKIELLADDGKTPIARTAGDIDLKPGEAYQVTTTTKATTDRAAPAGAGRSR